MAVVQGDETGLRHGAIGGVAVYTGQDSPPAPVVATPARAAS